MLAINIFNILAAEEEERLENLRNYNIERRFMREQSDCFGLADTRFIELFRLTKDMAQYVLNAILPHMENRNNPVAIPAVIKFFGALHFFATGSYQRIIGQSYNISMSQQCMSKAILEVTNAIVIVLCEQWIQFPQTAEKRDQNKAIFMEATGFPGVIGAVDATHIEIVRPTDEEHNYLNRKGFHSKNVQIICDYNLRILNLNARYAGATHDSFIWRNSRVQEELQRCYVRGDRNLWLVGDSDYPQQPWLMTPIENAQPGSPEYLYTQVRMRTRNCVERCIGILKGRFRCLLKIMRYSPAKVGNIINVCSILHNICVEGRLNIHFDIPPPQDIIHIEGHNRGEHIPLHNEGILARRTLINQYFR